MGWSLEIDHVPFAWRDLSTVSTALAESGLTPEYGGQHDNGSTHMALVGFPDGSYLELIAERSDINPADSEHTFWPAYIRSNAGPAAWFARSSAIRDDCRRLLDAGVPIDGPRYGSRMREDGTLIEWDWARFGTAATRQLLPYLIADRTPRSDRVSTTPGVDDLPLSGINQVVLGVSDIEERIALFTDLFGFPVPNRTAVPKFGTVASFPGQPVALATPTDSVQSTDWLSKRLKEYPDGPCAVLLDTDDLAAADQQLLLREQQQWAEGKVAFFDNDLLSPHLGVLDR